MLFHVNSISSYSEKANKVCLSFVNQPAIPADFCFTLFMPKSVEVQEGQDCEIPHFVASNIWSSQQKYILPELEKAARKAVHKRAEKQAATEAARAAFLEAKNLNVEEVYPEVGEHYGNVGEEAILNLKITQRLFSRSGSYTGIWTHTASGTGFGHWTHPTYCKITWKATDQNGRVFIFTISNDNFNYSLKEVLESGKSILLRAKIEAHSEFRGEKQTVLSVRSQAINYAE